MIKFYFLFGFSLLLLAGCSKQFGVAYLSSDGGNFDIFCIDPGGGPPRRLTTNPGWDWYPKWNEGRQLLVYYSNDTARNFSIRAMNLQGEPKPLDTHGLEEFILSPDGKQALFTV